MLQNYLDLQHEIHYSGMSGQMCLIKIVYDFYSFLFHKQKVSHLNLQYNQFPVDHVFFKSSFLSKYYYSDCVLFVRQQKKSPIKLQYRVLGLLG